MSGPIFDSDGASVLSRALQEAITKARDLSREVGTPDDVQILIGQALDFADRAVTAPITAAFSAAMVLADLTAGILEVYRDRSRDPLPLVESLRAGLAEWIKNDWQKQIDRRG
jgi:hypothetical protein